MVLDVKIYSIKDLIRKNVSGNIDLLKTKEIVRKLGTASLLYPDHNILVDMRDTTIAGGTMSDVIEITQEFMKHLRSFKNKIAIIAPSDEERISTAKSLEACMVMKGYEYKVFSVFEEALEWLSEVKSPRVNNS